MARNLNDAKAAKKDEFYTQYPDIEKEIGEYIDYNPDVFRDKALLLPCDDPEWSNFTRYFALHFEDFGLKKLISTSYAPESKLLKHPQELTLFETESPQFDPAKAQTRGKIFILDRDVDGNGRIDINDLQWQYLEGDGDFRSEEITKLRDEADIIITNPPFSLFISFFEWIMVGQKDFIIIGNQNAITYKEVFPYIMRDVVWLGTHSGHTLFEVPDTYEIPDFYDKSDKKRLRSNGYIVDSNGKLWRNLGNICWFTNIEHGKRHEAKDYMTMAEVKKFSKHKDLKEKCAFMKYDNYDAIEIPYYDAIPRDYDGIMGVPISYLDKYCPEQFEILGATQRGCHDAVPDTKKYDDYWEMTQAGKRTGASGRKTNENANLANNDGKKNYFLNADGHIVQSAYQRIFIRKKSQL